MPNQNTSLHINLARLAWSITSLGPGQRLGLWVAGCQMRCPGCISPELQSVASSRPIEVARLAGHILQAQTKPQKQASLAGLSLSGGEPFDQPLALAQLWQELHQAQPHWNLLVFSGYPWSRLEHWPQAWPLLQVTDLLISGPYRADDPSDLPLQASANQERIALSTRGEQMLAELDAVAEEAREGANLGFDRQGRGWLIGVFHQQERERLHQRLGVGSSLKMPE